jgi:hypothetical protein
MDQGFNRSRRLRERTSTIREEKERALTTNKHTHIMQGWILSSYPTFRPIQLGNISNDLPTVATQVSTAVDDNRWQIRNPNNRILKPINCVQRSLTYSQHVALVFFAEWVKELPPSLARIRDRNPRDWNPEIRQSARIDLHHWVVLVVLME